MKILLINPICRLPYMLPLGLGYIASVMRAEGHDVKMLDINGFQYTPGQVEGFIKELEFDIAGIGGLTSTYKYVKWTTEIIKKHKPGVPVVAGNMVATAYPELLLKNSRVDIAVIDEGELTFKELVGVIEKGQSPAAVKGIVYKDDRGAIIENPPRERIKDLDSLPFPAWDLFPMETYLTNSITNPVNFGLRTINVSTVRGCPYECTFCSRCFGRQVYARSAKSIVNEVRRLKDKYGVKCINFSDDLFLFNEKRALEFCDIIIGEKMDVIWTASGRVNLVNYELLKKMRRAGCVELGFGLESASQGVLDRMKKHVTLKQMTDAVNITRKAGIRVSASFIFGMPGETKDTVRETVEFIKKHQLSEHRLFYATPYPGTELYRMAKEMGRLPRDEEKYVESLGEMWKTFLVNLTDFSDEELVVLKNKTEETIKKNFGLKLKLASFIEEWRWRYTVFCRDIRLKGFMAAAGAAIRRVSDKFSGKRALKTT